jgi:hypothetical protein
VAGDAPAPSFTPVVPCIPLWIEEPHRRKSPSELLIAEFVCCCSEKPQSKEPRPSIIVDADVPEGHGSRCGNHCAARDEECDAGRACGAMGRDRWVAKMVYEPLGRSPSGCSRAAPNRRGLSSMQVARRVAGELVENRCAGLEPSTGSLVSRARQTRLGCSYRELSVAAAGAAAVALAQARGESAGRGETRWGARATRLGCSRRPRAAGNPWGRARASQLGCRPRELWVAAAGAAAEALAQARGESEGEGKPGGGGAGGPRRFSFRTVFGLVRGSDFSRSIFFFRDVVKIEFRPDGCQNERNWNAARCVSAISRAGGRRGLRCGRAAPR